MFVHNRREEAAKEQTECFIPMFLLHLWRYIMYQLSHLFSKTGIFL